MKGDDEHRSERRFAYLGGCLLSHPNKAEHVRPFAGDIKRAQKPEINWTLFLLSLPRVWDGECKFLMTLMLFAVDKKINKNEMSSSVKKLEVTERKTRGKRTFPVPIDGI